MPITRQLLSTVALLAACGGGDSGTDPGPDNEAPSVALGAIPGNPLSGTVNLTATAVDNVGVVGVQFLLDDQPVGAEDVSVPFGIAWNTTVITDGNHTVTARARDAAGNTSTSSGQAVTLQNSSPLRAIIATSGLHLDPDGYLLALDGGAPQAVNIQDTVNFASLSYGAHQVTLTGRKLNCITSSPLAVNIAGPALRLVTLSVSCEPDQVIFNLGGTVKRVYETGTVAPNLPMPAAPLYSESVVRMSPAGIRLIFDGGGLNPSGLSSIQVWTMQVDGSGGQQIASEDFGSSNPQWSPDGLQVLYTGIAGVTKNLFTITPTGANRNPITPDSLVANGGSYSPDGLQVAFEAEGTTPGYDIWTMGINGSNLTRLTSDPATDARAAWSPLGDKIAFMSARQGPGLTRIYVMDATGGNQVQLSPDSLHADFPAWSPDGALIAFVAYNDTDGTSRLFLMAPDGSGLTQLFPAPFGMVVSPPSWRPR